MTRKLGKKLMLNRETVRELTDSQLRWVAGGDPTNSPGCGGGGPLSWVGPGTQGGCGSAVLPTNTDNTCPCPTCGISCNPGCC